MIYFYEFEFTKNLKRIILPYIRSFFGAKKICSSVFYCYIFFSRQSEYEEFYEKYNLIKQLRINKF